MIDLFLITACTIALACIAGEIASMIVYKNMPLKILHLLKKHELSGYERYGDMVDILIFDNDRRIAVHGSLMILDGDVAWVRQDKLTSPLSIAPFSRWIGNMAYRKVKDIIDIQRKMEAL